MRFNPVFFNPMESTRWPPDARAEPVELRARQRAEAACRQRGRARADVVVGAPERRRARFEAGATQPRPSRSQAGIFWALLAVVLLSPWPLGSDRPLPASLLSAAIGALVLAWGLLAAARGLGPAAPSGQLRAAAALFAATLAWAVAQASGLTPLSLDHPYWAAARAVLTVPVTAAISVDPEVTWTRSHRCSPMPGSSGSDSSWASGGAGPGRRCWPWPRPGCCTRLLACISIFPGRGR
jgi:hypothetical protein